MRPKPMTWRTAVSLPHRRLVMNTYAARNEYIYAARDGGLTPHGGELAERVIPLLRASVSCPFM